MNYTTQILINDKWAANAIVFATETEAHNYGGQYMRRHRAVDDFRTMATHAEVTHTFIDGKLEETK